MCQGVYEVGQVWTVIGNAICKLGVLAVMREFNIYHLSWITQKEMTIKQKKCKEGKIRTLSKLEYSILNDAYCNTLVDIEL